MRGSASGTHYKAMNASSIAKTFFILFLLLSLSLGGVFRLLYLNETKIQQMRLTLKEMNLLNTQKEVIKSYIHAIATDVLTISKHYELRMMLDNNESHYRASLAREFLWFSQIKKIYDQVRFLDADGMERLRINFNNGKPAIVPVVELQSKKGRYYFSDTYLLSERQVFVSPLDLNIEHGRVEIPFKPMIRFGTPVFDSRGNKRGIVLLNYLGANMLNTLEALSKNATGKILLINPAGYYLRGMVAEDEWGFMFEEKKNKNFAQTYPDAWKNISTLESGHFTDNRGTFLFETIRPFTEAQVSSTGSSKAVASSEKPMSGSEYNWKLVSYIPHHFYYAEKKARLTAIILSYLTMLLILALGCGYISYARERRRMAEAEIRNHRDHLQNIVAQRTEELTRANKKLLEDIEERKRITEENALLEKKLLQAQKMEAVGTLAGGVAHDYNNMLSVIIGYAEIALESLSPGEQLHDDLKEILTAGHRSKEITRQLLAFARQQTVSPSVVDINKTVENMLKMLRRLIGEDIELLWHPGADLWQVRIDPTQIDQIIANLCVNARDAIKDVGTITIETKTVSLDETFCSTHRDYYPGDFVVLTVSDDGSGMDKKTQEKIFDPFFTTKALGRGTGLGLSTVYGIVQQNNGFIILYSEPNVGTTFKIYLPKFEGAVIEERKKYPDEIPMGKGEALMVVEDEHATLVLVERILKSIGYQVISASSPLTALKMAEVYEDLISLVITDVVMPEMNGRELSGRMGKFYPGIKCLFMSGYTSDVIAHRGVLEEGIFFIEKPFSKKDLAVKVREMLDAE